MRALNLLDDLVAALPAPGPSPIAMLKLKNHERERATGRRKEL